MDVERYVITTWPGYFFQTVLCIKSILEHLPARPIHIIVDDLHNNGYPTTTPWPGFLDDLVKYVGDNVYVPIEYHRFSDQPWASHCDVGWWRQQLVKLNLDQYIPGNSWFVIDADIIFAQTPDFGIVPVNLDRSFVSHANPIDIGNKLYVKYMLNTELTKLTCEGFPASSSGVPFRTLDRTLLQSLRKHVESIHHKDFNQLHIDLCNQQEIVGFDPEAKKMVMSEFELIEVFRQELSGNALMVKPIGCDHTYTLTPGPDRVYRHSSKKDWQLGREWLQAQNLNITDAQWQMSKLFIENMPTLQK